MPPPPAPRPRTVYSAVLLDPQDFVLVVHHEDAPEGVYDLPGLASGENGTGWMGLATAVKSATGLDIIVGRLLATDWTPADPATGTPVLRHRVRFCGRVPHNPRIVLGDGMNHYRWLAPVKVPDHCGAAARRIRCALAVQASGERIDPRETSSVAAFTEV
ncbi:NUDIX hydrolase [Streptomyces monomycini]|uniref:NUDIX hydrolase n=1 Tax=Streptomyces monomycini TaxID=371720 RepID=UPI0004AB6CA5|nr:NUDIX hydrolase [Streptomyces monomycini]